MATHRIIIIDQDAEDRKFIWIMATFLKYFLLPMVVWLVISILGYPIEGFVIGVALGLLIGFRKRIFNKRKSDWERIERLPDWAYRKMKKKRTNRVNGDHYVYKKEHGKPYRKLK